MTIFDLLFFHKELLQKLDQLGISTSDYKLADIYSDYLVAKKNGEKISYTTMKIADKYGISQRSVYSAISKVKQRIESY